MKEKVHKNKMEKGKREKETETETEKEQKQWESVGKSEGGREISSDVKSDSQLLWLFHVP